MLIAVGIFSSGSVNSLPFWTSPQSSTIPKQRPSCERPKSPIRTHDDRSRSYGYSRNNLSNGREVEQSEIVRIVREVLAQASRTEHEILTPRTSSTRETVTAQVAQSTCLERAAQYVNQLTDSVGAKRIEVEGDPTIAPRGVFAWNSIKIADVSLNRSLRTKSVTTFMPFPLTGHGARCRLIQWFSVSDLTRNRPL